MGTEDEPQTICLDVAIDHRIRHLFKPLVLVDPRKAEFGTHVATLESYGEELGRPKDEIKVTGQLAGPATTGGIAVALQQPRDNHPFHRGISSVIEDCETLNSLGRLFTAASCGTIDIQKDVSIIDLLPYLPGVRMGQTDGRAMKRAFETSSQALCDKQPDVVLCAGRIQLPRHQDDRKGNARRFENVGVGQAFKVPDIRIWANRKLVAQIPRVNVFHPSYAVNRHTVYSSLRQLLMLEVAQTCGVCRGDWRADPERDIWMEELRESCSALSKTLNDIPRGDKSSCLDDSPEAVAKPSKFLPYYTKLYLDELCSIHNIITGISESTDDPVILWLGQPGTYEDLLKFGLSEHCNNARLILLKMSELKERGWPDKVDKWNRDELKRATDETLAFVRQSWDKSRGWFGSKRLVRLVLDSLASINRSIEWNSGKSGRAPNINLDRASDAFLEFAEGLETMLWDLMKEEEGHRSGAVANSNALQLGSLVDRFGRVSLSQQD